ncbi:MAG: four helix bundle protein [Patescibacteria group bacterium]
MYIRSQKIFPKKNCIIDGSLKELKYLLYFSNKQKFFNDSDYGYGLKLAEEIGAMLWTEICALETSLK